MEIDLGGNLFGGNYSVGKQFGLELIGGNRAGWEVISFGYLRIFNL